VTDRETQELVRMIEANWQMRLSRESRDAWREALMAFEPELATQAIALLARRHAERPSVAEVRSAILSARRDQLQAASLWQAWLPEQAPRPEWVTRWERARAAGDFRIFPEQIPGYIQMQEGKPIRDDEVVSQSELEVSRATYALPATVDDRGEWVQPDEYVAATK